MGELSEVDKARVEVDFAALANMTPAELREWGQSPFAGQNRLTGSAREQAKQSLSRVGYLLDQPVEEWSATDYALALEAVERIEDALKSTAKEPLSVEGSEGPAEREADAIARQTRNASARAKARWSPERQDYAADSITVMLPIPADIAAQFPPDEKRGAPHVTMVYCGPGTEAQLADVALIVADVLGVRWAPGVSGKFVDEDYIRLEGQDVRLAGLDYFEGDARVAFARVVVPADVATVRARILARIQSLGIEVPNPDRPWVPHATLAYLDSATTFEGAMPAGEWPVEAVEVWRGETRLIVRTNGRIDKLELVGTKWAASTDAGLKPIGTFIDEAEAREALRQAAVIRALSGRFDKRAPAVHTETRNFIEETRCDRIALGPVVDSGQDWSEYQVLYSRAEIVQPYRRDGKLYREYRSRADVFEPASLKSGVGIPWELKHSAALLTQDTVLGVARGCTLTVEAHQDGLHTAGRAKAWDRDLNSHAQAGGDVSVAYRLKIDPRPGTTDSGERFDMRQYRIRWNSLAGEIAGNAGTARVLPVRADAKSRVITSSDAMLAAAREARADSAPIYFDLSEWTRRADAVSPLTQPVPDQVQDTPMNSPLQILIAAAGVSPADLSAALGIAEPDLAKLIAGEVEMTTEQAAKLLAALVPARDTAPPATPAADMVAVKIGDAEFKVPAKVASEMTMAAEKAAVAGDRADRADQRADRAEAEKRTIAAQLKAVQDSQGSMISRADADQLVSERAMDYAEVIDLARRANGATWSPEVRKDAAGAEQTISLEDWQRGAIRGAYGAKADKIFARIDSAPAADRAGLLKLRLDDARELLDEQAHKSGSVRKQIDESRDNEAQRRKDEATRGDKDDLRETREQHQDHGSDYVGAKKPA